MPDPKEFTPPASQEEFDRIIAERLARQDKTIRAEFGDYADLKAKAAKFDEADAASKSDLQKAIERAEAAEKKVADSEAEKAAAEQKAEHEKQVAELVAKVSKDTNVPAEMLRGSTLEELTAHADVLKPALVAQRNGVIPNEGKEPANVTSEERDAVAKLFAN